MDTEAPIQPPQTLRGFCQAVIGKHPSTWPPDEITLGHEFVEFFQVGSLLGEGTSKELCRKLGINVTIRDLPGSLRGHNSAYQGRKEIVLGTVSGPAVGLGVQEHTLFHELRELIEYEFRELGCPTAASDLEARAERFASTVRSMAAMNFVKPAFENWDTRSGWGKLGLVLLGGVVGIASFAFFLLPHWEDRLPQVNPPR